ncbi:uncharacterized protein EKO05_0009802 [Ascochyta rabiei]|uniref:uncharacterized protein n=1 Tax=Didymella rabiei TaxID=5454 RepID=UPI0022028C38|nr:uncharacterized protein EKO05_0009802 [Ascochyta rabiei]UPX19542.1 hypothetical protein EKO05_0009802 [Ascochyta rabiei]
MKVFQALAVTLLSPTIVSAYFCNCYNKNDPTLKAASHLCHPKAYCYDERNKVQACILDQKLTDQECANAYPKVDNGKMVPDDSWKAECEHHVGGCHA